MDLNKVMLIGRLTRDPELRTTPNGQSVASFSVATGFKWKDANGVQQEKTEFHNIVAWRKLGEICGQYLSKGRRIYVEGRLETRDWTGQDGIKRYRTEIIADNMIMLDSSKSISQEGYSSKPAPDTTPAQTQAGTPDEKQVTEEEIQVENIPF